MILLSVLSSLPCAEAGRAVQFGLRGVANAPKDRLVAVPVYQRSFVWTRQNVAEFWSNLGGAFFEGGPEYFLGTIVLTGQASPPRDAVIDGQERLASTSILLAEIRDEFASRADD